MTLRVAMLHRTEYHFDRSVRLSPHVVRLRPAPHTRTPIRAYSLKVSPATHFINWQQDPFGNHLARLVFNEPTRSLQVTVDLIAEMTVINPFDFFLEPEGDHFPFSYAADVLQDLGPYLATGPAGPRVAKWLTGVSRKRMRSVDFLVALNQRVQQDIEYTLRMEPGVQTAEDTLRLALGSCRDSAWLLVEILRQLGLAARFVSGYLIQLAPDVVPENGPPGPTSDFTDLHAWAEVYLPGAGWVGLDPTSGLFAGEGHIPLACTPRPQSAAPITGATDRCEVEFRFDNRVTRVHEDSRVTRPYRDDQWASILALGDAVDRVLDAEDVRLTQGGEPTFVAAGDTDAPEWNTEALGTRKRELAEALFRKLCGHYASGALLHYGQGKWYPGEPLPRWALTCYWRADGAPVWQDPARLAVHGQRSEAAADLPQRFLTSLAVRLGLEPDGVRAGHEDVLYFLWKEGLLPSNLSIEAEALGVPARRRDLARSLELDPAHVVSLFSRGLASVTGYALPLGWSYDGSQRGGRWRSSVWHFRRDRMYLLPGDSPMGLRLPLDSLPWLAPEARELPIERSPFEPTEELGNIHDEVAARYHQWLAAEAEGPTRVKEQGLADAAPRRGETGPLSEVVRTAVCAEIRDGQLCIFLPPLGHLEHFLELLAAVEATAVELDVAVRIEGYAPPRDRRLLQFSVTPDPGVIEVNIHPSANWRTLVERTESLFRIARQTGLAAEKYLLDGRHIGTGGGNHMTLGGITPADSPLLRRPDLLRSLITYWQRHPALSYFFSGLFIGATSQAPRVDEARVETLYELEIAFQQFPQGAVPQPWLVDRLLRNLLVDMTGNTHRAEFCIDKLYSPDSQTGRLGILELRAFEMPPHERMACLQALLVRALVARFWRQPHAGRLVRWGTALQDRWMLPHWLWRDLLEVLSELKEAGYDFAPEWFTPFFEFRFPQYGSVNIEDIGLELRMAVEPWHVLGEEMSGGGTARYVDSSIERLQVRATGLNGDRYVLACNGRRVPLRNTGRSGEFVAGVRYRAWQPSSALHPTIPVHVPLVFDLVDTWNGRSIGGCTYHVAHAGGRSYDTFPVNANEAEARRVARFAAEGHTPDHLKQQPAYIQRGGFMPEGHPAGPMAPPAEERTYDYPHILDLRRKPR
jgi:uncharacterized protein (DUF2126 family)